MPRARRHRFAVLLAAVLALAGCSGGKADQGGAALPAAQPLLAESAQAMNTVQTAHFTLDVAGDVADLQVRHAEGVLTRAGNAKGTGTLTQFGATVEVEFVIVDKRVFLKGPTGGFQELPQATVASFYDPSAILDPDRGVAKVLGAIKDGRTEAKEKVGGTDAFRVAVTLPAGTVTTLVPGLDQQVTGHLWLAADTKRLLKAEFGVPASGSGKAGTVTLAFTDYDAPVTISAP
jgi:lipoprotein LprG